MTTSDKTKALFASIAAPPEEQARGIFTRRPELIAIDTYKASHTDTDDDGDDFGDGADLDDELADDDLSGLRNEPYDAELYEAHLSGTYVPRPPREPEPERPARESIIASVTHPGAASDCVFMPMTDLGIAERLNRYLEGEFIFLPDGTGLRWNGRVHAPVDEREIRRAVVATVRAAIELEPSFLQSFDADDDVRDRETNKMRKGHVERLRAFEQATSPARVWSQFSALGGVYADDSQFDSDPNLLNTPSAVIDLRTGARLKHDRKYMMRQITRASGRDVPMTADLKQVLDGMDLTDPSISGLMQTIMGIAVSGHTFKTFVHIHGLADTGKSTLSQSMLWALGEGQPTSYASPVDFGVFELAPGRKGDTPDPGIMKVRRMRYVQVDEAGDQKRIDGDRIKSLSAGSLMSVRELGKPQVVFESHMSIVMCGNDRVTMSDTDTGLISRLIAVKLTKPLPYKDPFLLGRMLKDPENLDAVLAWAIRGCTRFLQDGGTRDAMRVPESIKEESQNYMAALDPTKSFWEDEIEEAAVKSTTATPFAPTVTELMQAYNIYSRSKGVKHILSEGEFLKRLAVRGYAPTIKRSERKRGEATTVRGRFVDNIKLVNNTAIF